MAFSLADYFQKQGLKVVESAMLRVLGKAAVFVNEDSHYRQSVIQPAWESLPPPVRMLLRKNHDQWVEMFMDLRDTCYDSSAGTIKLYENAPVRVASVLRKYYPAPTKGAAAAPVVSTAEFVPDPEPTSVPLAQPVHPTNKREFVVGIDLGTTYSLIAHIDAQSRPTCITNIQGDLLTPSVVLFGEETIVGKEAVLASAMEPEKVAECVKRDMGAKAFRKAINGEFLPPEVISSFILRSLKADAERKFGVPIRKAVITVPAYFEETRRRATMDAGKLAGLEVLDIINEPTAAAIAYGYKLGFLDQKGALAQEAPLRVLVFDLGGGTFDITLVEIKGTDFTALATDGDVNLGGKDWDDRLIDVAAERFKHLYREDPRENPFSLQELKIAVEAAKRTLTERKKATIYVNHLGTRLKVEITREEFEEATAALLERTRMTAQLVVRQAGRSWSDIDRVLLVGGSTRMPMITRMLTDLTGKIPDASINPDEAVAHGAALYAELLAPRETQTAPAVQFSVTNVNSHSLGILCNNPETGRKMNKILIPKNSPLPQTVTKVFKTSRLNQKSVVIKVLEGENERPEVCTPIGTCAIRDLPVDLPANWPVRVSYTYESNGRLHVVGKLKGHQASVVTDFQRENGIPDDDLDLWMHYVEDEMVKD